MDPWILLAPAEGAQHFPAARHPVHELGGTGCAVRRARGSAVPAAGSSPHTPTRTRAIQSRATWRGEGGFLWRQQPGSKPSPKLIRPGLTAQRYWNFFSTNARIFLLFFFFNFIFNCG